ncbi:hypothetical protein BW723_11510 [Polaribacter reichenbachii]|uniref:Adhesin domain-containing protein n=1 Tax=Polaribacter reichenbachii TaxID=996801 RepID=A0A1B8TPM8_9FLAO|nr:hypothetical protein [Polaribacter reichenbachii]APZ46871.1 hypothetical protein BW723_11510 [Polaribacter reichenbachii]AUC17514.1 hypothetical protein BTO17_01955 [Polaribacter reichenbachii]OBY61611.1 hypothetical protein LPB301_16265 [Polaribacter reichenbachii]
MKTIKILFIFALSIHFLQTNAQEKKIKFNKGTLKICSSKNFEIEGYDGTEVIIKSLHDKRRANLTYSVSGTRGSRAYSYSSSSSNSNRVGVARLGTIRSSATSAKDSTIKGNVFFLNNDGDRKNGLKKLGKKNENSDLGIYFIIEKNGDELVFKDNSEGQLIMMSNERYQIKIPNSIKLDWQTNNCKEAEVKNNQHRFFNSKPSSLSNFNGEVEISSTLNNTKLKDVTGPVSINTIGGNVTIEFDKKTPQKLYSIYSNNGFIDITFPSNSDIKLDATGREIFSDIDFKIEEETEERDLQIMKLKLNNGKVKMKLNANLGNIYLRKKSV